MNKFLVVIIVLIYASISLSRYSQNNDNLNPETPEAKANRYIKELQKSYSIGSYNLHKIYSDSLLEIATKHNLSKMQVLALTNQAVFYKNRNERLKAIELYHEALKKCEKIPEDFKTKIVVLVNMGNIYNDIGSYKKGSEYMQKVLELLDANENSDAIRAAALIGIANNYVAFKNYDKTIFYSEQAKDLGEKLGNEEIIISAINNMSDAYIFSENYKKALKLNQSIAHLELLNKPTKKRASFLLNNGIANYHLNNFDKALKSLIECQKLSEEKNILNTQMYAHEFLAKVYEKQKEYKASVLEQKKYVAIRNSFLNDKKEASNADLNKEIDAKSKIIANNNEKLEGFSKNKTLILFISASLLLLLSGFLYFNIKRKRKLKVAQIKLQDQYRELNNDFSNYKQVAINESLTHIKTSKKATIKPYKNSSLTSEKREEYKSLILTYMTKEKPFINPEMTQSDLAKEIGISSHHFSEVLHYNFEQNFYNFINSYRILEAQNLMRDSKYLDAKILAIAYDSGFKSKSTFNRIFKNHTGITPSEYRNQLEN